MHPPDWNLTAPLMFAAVVVTVSFLITFTISPILSKKYLESFTLTIRIIFLIFLIFTALATLIVPGLYTVELNGNFPVDPFYAVKNNSLIVQSHFHADFSLWGFHMETNVFSYLTPEKSDPEEGEYFYPEWMPLHTCLFTWPYGPSSLSHFIEQYYESRLKEDPIPVQCLFEYLSGFDKFALGPPPSSIFKTAAIWSAITITFALTCSVVASVFLHKIVRYGAIWLFVAGIFFALTFIIQYLLVIEDPRASKLFNNCGPFVIEGNAKVYESKLEMAWVLILCIIAGALAIFLSILILILDLRFPQLASSIFSVDVGSQADREETMFPMVENRESVFYSRNSETIDVTHIPVHRRVSRRESVFERLQKPRRGLSEKNGSFKAIAEG